MGSSVRDALTRRIFCILKGNLDFFEILSSETRGG